ncbi:MAG: GDSL-type esterase/lipase family protein, partial [Ruminococcus sp.]
MSVSFFKRAAGAFIASAMALSCAANGSLVLPQKAQAAGSSYHFDFGGNGAASGYTAVSSSDGYNSQKGYGFANTSGVKNVSAGGSGALSDAVQFTDTSWSNTFNVDLPNGLYRVSVTLGNTNRTSVVAENVLQIMNMTGNNAYDSILIPITDGQLNIMATNGKEGYAHTMSALDIEWVSADTQLPPTIWMCGDSTVCNYYPKDTSVQAGWGQVLDQYIDTSKWQVRNMAASGQYAKGFVNAGQFDPILKYGKEGDIYIISIGINDTNYSNADEYTATVTDMVQKAKAKGMRVILVKQQGRASDVNRSPLLPGRWFGGQLDAIGAAENVQVIDLFTLWQNHTTSIGYEATLNLYCTG